MRFLSITEFKDAFGYSKVNSQAIDDNTILYYLDRASLQVDTLTGANVLKGIDAGAWKQNPDSSIIVNDAFFPDPSALQEAKRALEMVRESIGLYTKFALDTGYDFISGSFSSSLGSQSSTENIDFNNSLLMLEHKVKSLLANFNFARIISIENISLEHEISYSSNSKKEKEYLTRDEFFSYISNPQSGGVIQAGIGIKIEKTNPQNEAAGITISTEGGSPDARITALENKLTFNGVASDSFKNTTDAVATKSWVNGIQQEIQNQIVPDINSLDEALDSLSTSFLESVAKIDVLNLFKAIIEGVRVQYNQTDITSIVDFNSSSNPLQTKNSLPLPFSPTEANIYPIIKLIAQAGTNQTITSDDVNSKLIFSSSGGSGGTTDSELRAKIVSNINGVDSSLINFTGKLLSFDYANQLYQPISESIKKFPNSALWQDIYNWALNNIGDVFIATPNGTSPERYGVATSINTTSNVITFEFVGGGEYEKIDVDSAGVATKEGIKDIKITQDLNMLNKKIKGVAAATSPDEAVNKSQLDAIAPAAAKTWKTKNISGTTLNLSVLDDGDLINITANNTTGTIFRLNFGGVFQKTIGSGEIFYFSGFTTTATNAINASFRYDSALLVPISPIQWFGRTLTGNTATNGVITAYTIRYYSSKTLA